MPQISVRKGLLAVVPGQVLVAGVVVALLDRAAVGALPEGMPDGEIGPVWTRPATLFFGVVAVLFAAVVGALWRGSARGVAVGLAGMGVLTPVYLGGLVVVALMETHVYDGFSVDERYFPHWYPPGRAAVLGAAGMAYLVSVVTVVRGLGGRGHGGRPSRLVAVILGHLPLVGVNITILDLVAAGQAGPIAREEVRAAPAGEYAGVGDYYLGRLGEPIAMYALLFGLAGVIALVLAGIVWRAGVSTPLLVVHGVMGIPLLVLLLMTSALTPFALSGAGGEPFPEVLASGPGWYLPAVLTHTTLGAAVYVASVVLMIRAMGRATATERTRESVTS
ncbi:hypothetical protein [Sphaerisporangium aureirubrum]|uniref:Uncharacterized protein n=1 Tax=Sphaerisporangium aureirubrum TaxID=1544736 RepID=A0ABW1NH68_9ACTN